MNWFVCPNCGNDKYFVAQTIDVTLHNVPFGPDGYSYTDYDYSESDILTDHNITCQKCQHTSVGTDFIKESE